MSDAGRWRFGAIGARDRGWRRGGDRVTKIESAYDRRRACQETDDPCEGDEAGIGASAGVAHLACAIALTLVMHRTDLSGEQPRAALLVGGGGGPLAAECQRRGDNPGDLAREPETDDPRGA